MLEKRATRALMDHVLAYAAGGFSSDRPDEWDERQLAGFDCGQFERVIRAGLGPLLYRAAKDSDHALPASWCDRLLSAHLTARIRHGCVVDTAAEIIDACAAVTAPVTLLKGISISDQFYPEGYLRPMSDIDILVSADVYEVAEAAILRCGYRRSPHPTGAGRHHGAPLYHPGRRVWVEIHTALFPRADELQRNNIFSPSSIAEQSLPSTFQERPVKRLTIELQLAYIASYWVRDLTRSAYHPSFVIPLLDVICLLKASGPTLNWSGLLDRLDNPLAMASLHVMLTYLARRRLGWVEPWVISRLATGQRLTDALQVRIAHAALDRYLMAGRSWNYPFSPPTAPGRYSVPRQLEKIISRFRARLRHSR